MPTPVLVSPISKQIIQKKRVAAYCRVSSSSADQLNSYANQIEHYTKLFSQKPEWTKVEIFADEGISGTKAKNRTEFQRMIKMCEYKQIDIIITKSVSRFARNVPEALDYIRELKLLGVTVIFEKEGINTMSIADEMLLSVFTARAQEESQSISQNQRFSIVKRMEMGDYVDPNAPYGYRLVDKKLEIHPEEAQIVINIYNSYLNGMSTAEIAKELTIKHIPTKQNKEVWRSGKISYILSNEKYIGDSFYQKTYRSTTVPFKQSKNRGEEDRYYATDTHRGIISKETFDKVQLLLKQRKEKFGREQKLITYPLTSRIRCSECGSFFRRKIRNGCIKWVCSRHEKDSKSCESYYYSEDRIYDGFIHMINKLRFGDENILDRVISNLEYATLQHKRSNKSAMEISESIASINAQIVKLNELLSKGYLSVELHHPKVKDLESRLKVLKDQRQDKFESGIFDMLQEVKKFKKILYEIEEPLENFNEKLFSEVIKDITINNRDEMTITVLGGLKFTELI